MSIIHDRTKTVVRRRVAPGEAVPLHLEAVGFAGHHGFDIDLPAAYRPTGKVTGPPGLRSRTSIVRRTGNRFSVNTMSAISTKGRMHFMVFTETFDADVMCRFLDRLASHFDRTVHLVLDGHSVHRSRKVRAWLADHPRWRSCSSRTSRPLLLLWTRYEPVWR